MTRRQIALIARALTTSAVLLAAATVRVEAQTRRQSKSELDRWGIAAALGATWNGDRNETHFGLDYFASLRAPVRPGWSIFADIGRARWRFDTYGSLHDPRRDSVSLRRVTLSIVRKDSATSWGYVGGGGGWYRYGADVGTFETPSRFGVHFRAGVEVPLRSPRAAFVTDFQVHAVRGPYRTVVGDSPVFSYLFWTGNISFGIRVHLH